MVTTKRNLALQKVLKSVNIEVEKKKMIEKLMQR